MAGSQIPGPLGLRKKRSSINDGTLARQWSPLPGPIGLDVLTSLLAEQMTNFYTIEKGTGKARRLNRSEVLKAYSGADLETKLGSTDIYILHYGGVAVLSSQATIDTINAPKCSNSLVGFAIGKLRSDASHFHGQFPVRYYADFAKFLFQQSHSYHLSDPDQGVRDVADLFGKEVRDSPAILPVYHIYEAIARVNDDNGYDKVQHFVKSAVLQYQYGSAVTDIGQYGKEIHDEIKHWRGETTTGFDRQDLYADNLGQAYGAELYAMYHPIRNFFFNPD